MKIYHKKNFAAGLLALAAGTGILLYSLWNGFSLYNLLWTGNFFWLGCKALEHSLSREPSPVNEIQKPDPEHYPVCCGHHRHYSCVYCQMGRIRNTPHLYRTIPDAGLAVYIVCPVQRIPVL